MCLVFEIEMIETRVAEKKRVSEYYTLDCQEAEVDVWKLRIFCEPPRWMHVYYYYYFVSTRGQFFFNGLLSDVGASSHHLMSSAGK